MARSPRRPVVAEVREFTCPECGGHTYGTDLTTNRGACHGHLPDRSPCRFTWSRDDDDCYFRGEGCTISGDATGEEPGS